MQNKLDLNNKEREQLKAILNKVKDDKYELAKPKQIREIVPVDKWLENEYFVGASGVFIYDKWKQAIKDIYEGDKVINEVIASGGIGIGKTTLGMYCFLRKLYELSCYKNIAGLFNLMKSSKIAFMYFSVNLRQAELTGYGQLKSIIDETPYFKNEFPRNERVSSRMEFPENVYVIPGSGTQHAIGVNLIGSILDEANFGQGESTNANVVTLADKSKVEDLYTALVTRGKSRFLVNGVNHSMSFLISSTTCKGSMTDRRIKTAEAEDFKHTYLAEARLWEVKPKGTYSDEMFTVFIGTDALEPLIVNDKNDINQIRKSLQLPPNNISFKDALDELKEAYNDLFGDVPIDFRKDFESNMLRSIQDILGMNTSPTGGLFTSRPKFYANVTDKLEHPFTKDVLVISTDDQLRIEDYIKRGYRFKNAHLPHYIHIDQSKNSDSTGVCMCHIDRIYTDNLGNTKFKIVVDFLLRIDPPKPPAQISITKVREFIYFLNDIMGVNVKTLSYDSAFSAESLQLLKQKGYDAIYQSVDRTDSAYLQACSLLYEQNIEMYNYQPLADEFFFLVHDRQKRKVDHLPQNAKDVSDGFVGALNNAMNDLENVATYFEDDSEDDLDDWETEEDILNMDYLLE